jgi:hypothetical protein
MATERERKERGLGAWDAGRSKAYKDLYGGMNWSLSQGKSRLARAEAKQTVSKHLSRVDKSIVMDIEAMNGKLHDLIVYDELAKHDDQALAELYKYFTGPRPLYWAFIEPTKRRKQLLLLC